MTILFMFFILSTHASNRPTTGYVVQAEFNSPAACMAAAKTLQQHKAAEAAYCVPKGTK